MDLSELLMVEHSAIRREVRDVRDDFAKFQDLNSFVINYHALIEDEIFFPAISESFKEDDKFVEIVDRISKDHQLISKLGENLTEWHNRGKDDLVRERIQLYIRLLTDHNNSEEKEIFKRWILMDKEKSDEHLRTAIKRIREIGADRYQAFTGISEKFLDYILENL